MPNVGTASIDIDVDGARLGSNIRRAVNSQSSGITSAFRGLGRMGGDALSAGFSGAIHVIEKVGLAAGVAGVALGGFGLKVAGDFQQTRIAFEGILGSAEKAQTFLTKLRDFAAKTPFEFPELATASKSLLAVGFSAEDVIPIMTKLGNVAATLGVGGEAINGVVRALGQMKGKGKASAEEMNQISEQIPGFSAVKAIAEDMGISVAEAFKLMEKGAIPADRAISAILKGMEKFPGAAGAMERQSKTLNGVISTLKDTFRDALIDGIEPFLPAISDGLVKAQPLIKSAVTGLMGALKTGIVGVKAFFAAFSGEGVTSDGFVGVMEKIGVAARALVGAFKEAWPQIKATVADAGERIAEVVGRIVEGFGQVVGWVRANWPEIKTIITDTVTTIRTVIEGAVDSVQTIWRNFHEQLEGVASGHWEGVKSTISGALDFIKGITQTVTAILHADWSDAWEGIKGIFTGAWGFLTGGQEMFNAAFTGLASAGMEVAQSAFNAAWDSIKSVFDSAWDGLVSIVRGGIANVVDAILGMVGTIIHAADTAFGWIPGIGSKLGDAAAAFDNFRAEANAAIRGIDAEKTITINIVEAVSRENNVNLGTAGDPIAPAAGSEDNATEALPDRAHGIDEGPLPGRLGEPMLVRAHAGEWVVTPEQMKDLTSGRSGGAAAPGVGIDYDRLADAMARVQLRVAVSDVAKGLHGARRP